jgi:Bacterial Ig-like domain (group 3)
MARRVQVPSWNWKHLCVVGLSMWLGGASAWAATLHVDTAADTTHGVNDCSAGTGSSCSLRDAINQADSDGDGDTIVFNGSLDGGTITLASALPAINVNVTVTGPGANLLTISGASSYEVFAIGIAGTPTVTISGLTVAKGQSSSFGGAILLEGGTLTVTDCAFSGNAATSGGGAIVTEAGTTLTVSGSTFAGNTGGTAGGAIFNSNNLVVTNSTFSGNHVSLSNGGGGAIGFGGAGTATVTNNTFSGNYASGTGSRGGAIYLGAGNTLTADNNVFSGNTASSTGAGIDNQGGTANADHNVYYGNVANGSEDDCNGCSSNTSATSAASNPLTLLLGNYGGTTETFLPQPGSQAICAGSSSAADLPADDQRGFALNASCVDAGADQTNYIQVQNAGDAVGGACPGASCTLRDAIAAAGSAGDIDFKPGIAAVNLTASNGTLTLGGATGIEIAGPGASTLTVNGNGSSGTPLSVFTVNSGAQALLSGLTISGGYASADGGAVLNRGTLTILGSDISGNIASSNGGGIENNGGALTVVDSTISGNSAIGGGGGGIDNEGTGASASIVESTIYSNSVSISGSGGGGVFNTLAMSVTGSTIVNNTDNSVTGGGGFYQGGSLSLANSVVAGNTSQGSGANALNAYTDGGGNVVGGSSNGTTNLVNGTGAAITLSSLELNGATDTVPTAIPLPGGASGSPVICAGLAANIPSGVTTDERGYPVENITYPGYSSGSPCVDAGAVQTNYSMRFTTSPPATLTVDQALNADVTLEESGAASAVSGVTIPVTISSGTLYGTASESTSAGVATFSDVTATEGSGDTLTSTLSLNAAHSLTASSSSFDVNQAATAVTSLTPATPPAITVNNSVSFTAKVAPSGVTNEVSAGNEVPMAGTVTFLEGGSAIGNCTALPVTPGVGQATATCTTTELKGGNGQTIAAQYNTGDANYEQSAVSVSPAISTITVNAASTTTALTSNTGANSSNGTSGSSNVNQSVSFNVTVSAPAGASVALSGNVTFTDNGSPITVPSGCGASGVVAVVWNGESSTGTASCTTSALIGGNHTIVATYNKDSSDSSYLSSNNNVTEVVSTVATTVATPMLVSPASPVVGDTVVVSAAVAPTAGGTLTVPFSSTGTMTFFNGVNAITSCTDVAVTTTASGATASCSIAGLTANTYNITARYNTGDPSYSSSTSATALSLTIGKNTLTVAVTSSAPLPAGATVNQPVTFAASMTASQTLTGTVKFTDNSAPVSGCTAVMPSSTGVATCTDPSLAFSATPHVIQATYSGDSNYSTTVGTLTGGQTVNQGSTSVTLSSSANPSAFEQSVTFTATVTPNPSGPTGLKGAVTFVDSVTSAAIPGCSNLTLTSAGGAGQATCTTAGLAVSPPAHTITASYGSDSNFSGSSSNTFVQTVNPATSQISLTLSSPSPLAVNTVEVFTANIPLPTGITSLLGTVSFTDNGSAITNCPPVSQPRGTSVTCADSGLTAGTHTIVAAYTGDPKFSVSNATTTLIVTPGQSSTVLTSSLNPAFTSNGNSSNYRDSVTFTATVSAPAGATVPLSSGGTIAFSGNGIPAACSSVTPTAGVATCTAAALPDGANSIVATYSGDTNYATSSGAVMQTVEDYSVSVGPVPATTNGVLVTQGYALSNDLFNPSSLSVTPTSIAGFTGSPTIACAASGAGAPKCSVASSPLTIVPGSVQQSVGVSLDATSATPGTYAFTITATDPTTSIVRTTTFPVTVRAVSAPLVIPSGATTGNTGTVTFTLPAGVTLSNLSCPLVAGTGITSYVEKPSQIGMACAISANTIGSPGSSGVQHVSLSVTVTTSSTIASTAPPTIYPASKLLAAGLLGLPFFGLIGLVRGRKSAKLSIFRVLAILAIGVATLQAMGCGGSFKSTSTAVQGGTTPPGTYFLLVQGTGSDNNTYQAVLEVQVSLL